MPITIPAEGAYGSIERDWIDFEPEGIFPESQDSFWGQMRAVFCDYLETNIKEVIDGWFANADPRTANSQYLTRFENMVGLPTSTGKSLNERRAFVLARLQKGAFTRPKRNAIIELFITATFGDTITFVPEGIPFDSDGIPFFSGVHDLAGAYTVVEDITGFSFAVTIADDIDIDIDGLTRELARISPYSFTIDTDTRPL